MRAFQSAIRNKITLVKMNKNTFCYILAWVVFLVLFVPFVVLFWFCFFPNVPAHLKVDLQNLCGSQQNLESLHPVRGFSEAERFRKENFFF